MNLNANDDTDEDAKEILSPHKKGVNKVYKEFKTYSDLKKVTEDIHNLSKGCLKLRMKI